MFEGKIQSSSVKSELEKECLREIDRKVESKSAWLKTRRRYL